MSGRAGPPSNTGLPPSNTGRLRNPGGTGRDMHWQLLLLRRRFVMSQQLVTLTHCLRAVPWAWGAASSRHATCATTRCGRRTRSVQVSADLVPLILWQFSRLGGMEAAWPAPEQGRPCTCRHSRGGRASQDGDTQLFEKVTDLYATPRTADGAPPEPPCMAASSIGMQRCLLPWQRLQRVPRLPSPSNTVSGIPWFVCAGVGGQSC